MFYSSLILIILAKIIINTIVTILIGESEDTINDKYAALGANNIVRVISNAKVTIINLLLLIATNKICSKQPYKKLPIITPKNEKSA